MLFTQEASRPKYGYVFDQAWIDPYESLVGILWKYALTNSLAAHKLMQQLSDDQVLIDDPYASTGLADHEVDLLRIARLIGIPKKAVQHSITKTGIWRKASTDFRWCPKCMDRGYHSVLHQYVDVQVCPIHGVQVLSRCTACRLASQYRLTAIILDSPFRCSLCGRRYAKWGRSSFLQRRPLDQAARTALTRSALCMPWYPKNFKPSR